MKNGGGILEGPSQTVDLADVLANELGRRVEEARREACRMNLRVQTIDDANLVPAPDQRIDQMRANESGTTNHDHAQGRRSLAARSRHDESVCNRPESPFQEIAGWKRIARAETQWKKSRTEKGLLSRGAIGAVVAAAAAPYINP
jgi:hypothetical protein